MDKCNRCPLLSSSVECVSVTRNLPHWCSSLNPDAEGHSPTKAANRLRAITDLSANPPAATVPGIPDGKPITLDVAIEQSGVVVRPELRVELDLMKRIRECDFRTPPACGCPSVAATCRLSTFPRLVWFPDCRSCPEVSPRGENPITPLAT